ncbi:MAG: porin [Pseudomonadota bacterium]
MKKQFLATLVLAAIGMPQAQAGALDSGDLSISGFGTLGIAKSDTGDIEFVRYNQAVGVKDSPRIGLDSNLGLQAGYRISDMLSANVQVLTRKNTSPQFTTELTWAFMKVKFNDAFSLRVGRVVLPVFAISDYQNLGYANTMMRPPIEMYGQMPLEGIDGIDASYQRAFGDTNLTLQGFGGVARSKLYIAAGGVTAKSHTPAYGFALAAEHGPATVRLAHMRADLSARGIVPIENLVNALGANGFAQLGRDLELVDKQVDFTEIGLNLDWKNLLVQAEYARRRPREAVYVPSSNSWYLMAGYRMGKLLPYFAHAEVRSTGTGVTVPAALAGTAPPLAAAVAGLLAPSAQSSNLVGVRWDFAQAMALKVQLDRVRPTRKNGALIHPKPGTTVRDVTVIGASLDFVF